VPRDTFPFMISSEDAGNSTAAGAGGGQLTISGIKLARLAVGLSSRGSTHPTLRPATLTPDNLFFVLLL
jgi:hypothetical protein